MRFNRDLSSWTTHSLLISWIEENISLCTPDSVHLCDGSDEEFSSLMQEMVKEKKAIALSQEKRPNSYLFRSDVEDVARVEKATFICSEKPEDAGPTNNWKDPNDMKQELHTLFSGCMKGRTMYVIPFSMGPIGSPQSMIGVQITDSGYVVCNMKIMTRMGEKALRSLEEKKTFVPCMHSVGVPLTDGQQDSLWPCNSTQRCIVHFPKERSIWSYGSGYGGNALLGKKCLALRIASTMAKEESWLAEHMLIVKITSPEGKSKYFAAAFPSACGKTNLAMLNSSLPGWKVECVGDDIAWMKIAPNGKLYAINPESGFFGVAPGTSYETNCNAMKSLEKNVIFTNVALTQENDVWWEGMTKESPEEVISWKDKTLKKPFSENASHPNARFTASIEECPVKAQEYDDPNGVEISAIIFGGRREDTVPLVREAYSWQQGVFFGASVSSQMTAAAEGTVGKLRHDPFAMLPFCGYHMGDYFSHWLYMGRQMKNENHPKFFFVNWFQKDENGKFIWPGFSENIRILKWMFERCDQQHTVTPTPIGYLPQLEDLDRSNLSLSEEHLEALFAVSTEKWLKEIEAIRKYFMLFDQKLPQELLEELNKITMRFLKKDYADRITKSPAGAGTGK